MGGPLNGTAVTRGASFFEGLESLLPPPLPFSSLLLLLPPLCCPAGDARVAAQGLLLGTSPVDGKVIGPLWCPFMGQSPGAQCWRRIVGSSSRNGDCSNVHTGQERGLGTLLPDSGWAGRGADCACLPALAHVLRPPFPAALSS